MALKKVDNDYTGQFEKREDNFSGVLHPEDSGDYTGQFEKREDNFSGVLHPEDSGTSVKMLGYLSNWTDKDIKKLYPILTYRGELETADELPENGNKSGDIFFITSENISYVWVFNNTTGGYSWAQFSLLTPKDFIVNPDEKEDGQVLTYNGETEEWEAKDIKATPNFYSQPERISDYLYSIDYNSYDYEKGYEYYESTRPDPSAFACSMIKKGDFVGRNFDFTYTDYASFLIRTKSVQGRYATMGMAYGNNGLTKSVVDSGEYNDCYEVLPFLTLDAINERGVFVSANIVPFGDKGHTTGTNPGKQDICQLMLMRYIADYAPSAREAINIIVNDLNIYAPIKQKAEECHFLICDANDSYIVEFVDNEIIIFSNTDDRYNTIPGNKEIVTNFYLTGWSGVTKAVYRGDTEEETRATGLTPHADGLERYDILANAYESISSKQDIEDIMASIKYTCAYNRDTDPFWYSEYVGEFPDPIGECTIFDDADHFSAVVEYGIHEYETRTRDGKTWQTVHTSVYDLSNKSLSIYSQEDYEHLYNFDFQEIPGKSYRVYIKDNSIIVGEDALTVPLVDQEYDSTSQNAQSGVAVGEAIEELSPYFENIDDSIDTINNDIIDINGDITIINENIVTINGEISTIEGDITTINGNIETINGEISTIENDITTINSDIQSINEEVTTIENDITTINENIDSINGEITTIEGDITTINGNIDSINSEIVTIESDITTINENIVSINGELDSIEEDITTINGNIESINGEIGTIESDIVTINGNIDSINDDISDIKNKPAYDISTSQITNWDNEVGTKEDLQELEDDLGNIAFVDEVGYGNLDNSLKSKIDNPANLISFNTPYDSATNKAATMADIAGSSGVSSFNGRTGAVVPVSGDYTPSMVGVSISERTVTVGSSSITVPDSYTKEETDGKISTHNTSSQAHDDIRTSIDTVDDKLDKTVLTTVNIAANTSTDTLDLTNASVNLKSGTTGSNSIAFPVASSDRAGVMNAATYQSLVSTINQVQALTNGTVAIDNLPESITQAQLTQAWKTSTGLTQIINGARIYDTANVRLWVYYSNKEMWYEVEAGGSVEVSQFTNSSLGTIKGSLETGQVYAETDGTGSVNGWDDLTTRVTNVENNVDSLDSTVSTLSSSLSSEISTRTSEVASLNSDITEINSEIDVIDNDLDTIKGKPAYNITSAQITNWDNEVGTAQDLQELVDGLGDLAYLDEVSYDKLNTLLKNKIDNPADLIVFNTSYNPSTNKVATMADIQDNSGVVSFNGRDGIVVPTNGDYTASMVGVSLSQRTISIDSSSIEVPDAYSKSETDSKIEAHDESNQAHEDIRSSIGAIDDKLNNTLLTSVNVQANSSTNTLDLIGANLNLKTGVTGSTSVAFPVASANSAGIMNSSIYNTLTDTVEMVQTLTNGTVAIDDLPSSVTQNQLTQAWKATTGISEVINGARIYDTTNTKLWTYYSNKTMWYESDAGGSVEVNQFTNNSLGTIKGSTEIGQIYAETNGTGSVNGWDALTSRVTNAESDIDTLESAVSDLSDSLDSEISTRSSEVSTLTSAIESEEAARISKDNELNAKFSNYAEKATTLGGYGITDAYISSGAVVLGSETITPLTSDSNLNPAKITQSSSYRLVTDSEKSTWNNKQDMLSAAQLDAVNSEINSTKVTSYDSHVDDTSIHVTSSDKNTWSNKYAKPSDGIPKSDLSNSVQASLDLADSALQEAPVTSVNGEVGDVVIDVPSVDQTYSSTSTNPQSGTAVAQALTQVHIDVDQSYDATSSNAQSGTAVAQAIATKSKTQSSSTNGNIKIDGVETVVYTHPGSGTNPHGTTKSDVGLGNVGNFKAVSVEANQGLTDTEKANARTNIGAGTSSFSGDYNDLSNKPDIPDISGKEDLSNKVTSWSSSTTNTHYPSEKLVKDSLDTKQNTLTPGANITISGSTISATDTTYSVVTTSTAGLMSAEDKIKLNGVAEGATANIGTITGITMNGASKGTSGVVDLGTVITTHQDITGKEDLSNKVTSWSSTVNNTHYPSEKLVKDSLDTKQNVLTAGANINISGNTISAVDTTYSAATTSSDGLMSSADKTKLNGIAEGATANTGTVTSVSVTMNGESKGIVTTSGTINLGTVLTEHQDISGKIDDPSNKSKNQVLTYNGTTWIADDIEVLPSQSGQSGKFLTTNGTVAEWKGIVADNIIGGTFGDERIASASIWNAKQDALTFDSTPTPGSLNPVTSGGIASSIPTKTSDLTNDSGFQDYDDVYSIATSVASSKANIDSPEFTGVPKAPTAASGTNTTQIATTAFVASAINDLPQPMVFKGSLGVGGTITELPSAAPSNEGWTYKVITDGTYQSIEAKVGDTFISNGASWIIIPSGDEPGGTVTSITLKATSPIAIDSTSAITTSGTRTLSHANSGATAGSYGDSAAQTPTYGGTFKVPYVTVNATGHVTGISEHTVKIPASDNTNQTIKVGTSTFGISDAVGLVAGSNVTITPDTTNDTITIAATDTKYSDATQSAAGLMSAADKTKLDGVAAGATANTGTVTSVAVKLNGTTKGTVTTSGIIDLGTLPTSDTNQTIKGAGTAFGASDAIDIVAGNNVTVTPDTTNKKITIAATDTTYSVATTSVNGLMSSTDKTKLDGIADGATKVVESTVSGWGFTKNTGTVTSIKMNGSSKSPSSGVVDLGTVITAHQDISGKVDKTADGVSAAINLLTTGDSTPQDSDYYVSQYAGGGTTTTTYHRRPMSALWAYIKTKGEAAWSGLTKTGTVTSVGVTMNGASKGVVTTSGTIDLGTVITSHQDISGKIDDPSDKSENQVLTYNGVRWVASNNSGLPDQSGHENEFLVTNGTTASWSPIINFTNETITIAANTLSYTVPHTHNTRDVMVQVYDLNDYANVIVDIIRPSNNSVQIRFGEQETVGKQFRVMIASMNNLTPIPSGEEVNY